MPEHGVRGEFEDCGVVEDILEGNVWHMMLPVFQEGPKHWIFSSGTTCLVKKVHVQSSSQPSTMW